MRNYKGAIRDHNAAIRLDPENIEAYFNRGNVKSDLENHKMAIEDYDMVIHLKPKGIILPLAYAKRASAKSEMGDNKGAIKDYTEAVRSEPNNPNILTIAYLNQTHPTLSLIHISEPTRPY